MNLEDANNEVERLKHLIGKTINGKNEISFFVIMPTKTDILGEIMKRVIQGYNYDNLLYPFNDFTVIVILDYDLFLANGFLIWDYLDNVLKKLGW